MMINSVYQYGFQNPNPYYSFLNANRRSPEFYSPQWQRPAHPYVSYQNKNRYYLNPPLELVKPQIKTVSSTLSSVSKKVKNPFDSTYSDTHKINKAHDGKFSFTEAAKNFTKGFVSPVTGMFESVKNFMIGTGILLGGAILVIATNGLAAPLLVGAGIGMGIAQALIAAKKINSAKNGDDIEEAFFEIGAATVAMTVSVISARSALHGAQKLLKISPEQINKMNLYKATIENLKSCPAALKETINLFRNGKAILYIKRFISFLKREPVHLIDPQIELVTGKSIKSIGKSSVGKSVRLSLAEMEGELIRGKLPKLSISELEGRVIRGKLSGLQELITSEELSSLKLPKYLLIELNDEIIIPKTFKSPTFELHAEIVPSQNQKD